MTISKIITENRVENDLGNLSFCSRKLANGKKIMARRNAKKKGARMLSPRAKRYPRPIMETTIKVSFTRKGSRSRFIVSFCCIKIIKTLRIEEFYSLIILITLY